MSTGTKWTKIGMALLLSSGLLCAGIPTAFGATSSQVQRKAAAKRKKQPDLPPIPSGPTGRPVPPIPLDAIAAVPPQVTFENNQLTINAPNSTLADVLRAVRKLTGADIDVPAAPERVVTHLGPGPARDVIAELLNGSRFNYVLLGSPTDSSALTRVVLVAKTGIQEMPSAAAVPPPTAAYAGQPNPQEPEATPDATEVDATDDNSANADDNTEQQPPPEAEQQQQTPPEQGAPGVKTPQQMLQEMQQRQMQMQQQGQPPAPGTGSGMQPHPPQQN